MPDSVIIHGIRNCDTMKKARAWLEARGIAHAFHDYKTAGLERGMLERWVKEVGWERLLNRAGTSFRKLPDAEKADLDESKAVALMLANPSLVKRPVLSAKGQLAVGFSPDQYERIF
ncbi:ArsC family reductase [Roseomonas sp. AR75]|uniref:ArsC family reductase n=1 Tax=Roseomonas sp. AR75 TaxID=2562311 RepID=UPI0010BFF2CC|nr:ArsC family reductase [Roseomonas sp. AR75]